MLDAVEAKASIPTLSELVWMVEDRYVASARQGGLRDDLTELLAQVFTSDDVTDLIAFARATHAAAQVFREQGKTEPASLLHAMAQDMLAKAVDGIGVALTTGVDLLGVQRH